MISFNVTQLFMKYAISAMFRFILIAYSIFILYSNDNFFDIKIYIGYTIIYFSLYAILLKIKKPVFRTINDYIFITLVLFDKDIEIVYNALLIILPLFNSPNHTENNREPIILYLIAFISYLFLYSIHSNNISSEAAIYSLTLIGTLYIIGLFEYYRGSLNSKLLNIYDKLDNIISKKKSTSQLIDVYKYIIESFKADLNFEIKMILVFEKFKGHTNIRTSSDFIHSYDISEIEKKLEENLILYNEKIILNNKIVQNAIIMKLSKRYIFVVIMNDEYNSINILQNIYLFELLIPIFKKIMKIIDFENALNKQKYNINKKLNQKSHFVNNIMKSTHYFKNKLSSITNYFVIKKDYESIDESDVELKKEAFEIVEDEERRANKALEDIIEKSLKVLNKDNNPFIPQKKQSFKYKRIYMIVKNIWMQYFFENEIKIIDFDDKVDRFINNLDENTLELMFTDIFANIRKHGIGNKSLIFDFSKGFNIKVTNNIKDFSNKKNKLIAMIENFNNSDRIEINKRQSYGISHIKELSDVMNINTTLKIDEEKETFITNLDFKVTE